MTKLALLTLGFGSAFAAEKTTSNGSLRSLISSRQRTSGRTRAFEELALDKGGSSTTGHSHSNGKVNYSGCTQCSASTKECSKSQVSFSGAGMTIVDCNDSSSCASFTANGAQCDSG